MTWGKPQVAEEPTYRLCRDSHNWRVTRFDYLASRLTERCASCGDERTRFIEAVKKRPKKPKKKRGAR